MGKKDQEPETHIRKGEPFDEMLPVDLTPTELVTMGRDLGQCYQDIQRLDDQLAGAKSSNKAAREPIEFRQNRLAESLRSGKEHRDVRCQRIYDWDQNKTVVRRLDTGEIISERPLTEAERQRELTFDEHAEVLTDPSVGGDVRQT